MKVARVVHSLYPESVGDYFGMYELSRRQVGMGDTVKIYTWSRSYAPGIYSEGPRFLITRLRGVNFRVPILWREQPFIPSLGEELEASEGDVIHAHSHLFLTSFQAALAARETGTPLVVTVHGVSASRGFAANLVQTSYLRTIGNYVFRTASRVICVSRSDVPDVIDLGCAKRKIRVIPNAVDCGFFGPKGPGRREREIIWVGRFVPEKGLDLLLWAMKSVVERRRAVLRLVGDGPSLPRIEALAERLGVKKHVIFHGRVGKEEVADLMSGASIFVLPSRKEGLPKALLQAMASELGVVASRIPGMEDVVEDGEDGILFEPGDVRSLVLALDLLLDDPSLARRLGRKGRAKVMRDYTWEGALERLNTVYEEARIAE